MQNHYLIGKLKLDLGIRSLIPEWKAFFSSKYLKEDLVAGAIVACVALPLSLALALASGVEPEVGLVTAIVAGIVCSLFGGTRLAVSGPANAMPVLVAAVIEQFGFGGLLVVGIGCGVLQLLTGVLGWGKLTRFIPVPVVTGFTAGIGALIFIGQLPRALGLPVPPESHIVDVVIHIKDYIHETHFGALALSLSTIGITFILPTILPRVPAPLVAVLIPSIIAFAFPMGVDVIGTIPSSLPMPDFPHVPLGDLKNLLWVTLIAYALASLETLLSSSSADKMIKGERHDPNQELIGQGLGNIASALFSGIPVTGVIARSALNIQAGARTRRAAIFHSLILVIAVYFMAPVLSQIPISVLAGVILSVALRMLHPREFLHLWKISPMEAVIYLITFFTIVFVGLVVGVQAGLIAALLIAAIRLGQASANIEISESRGPAHFEIDGPLTFMSSAKLDEIRNRLESMDTSRGVIVDLSLVPSMDATGANQLIEILEPLLEKRRVALLGVDPAARKVFLTLDKKGRIAESIATSESEIIQILKGEEQNQSLDRLIYGVEKFRRQVDSRYKTVFQKLATSQDPHTLLITCADSRIVPNLITSTEPGELFVVRNVGNIVPAYGTDSTPAEGAAIEFALTVLKVKEIIVCGHSECGAMKALSSGTIFTPEGAQKMPQISTWLRQVEPLRRQLPENATGKQTAELNALAQIESLKTYPIVREKLAQGEIRLHAWYYDIGNSELEEWDEIKKIFVTVGSKSLRSLDRRIEAGIQFQVPFEKRK
jgi:carbonic anhydrase